MGVAPGVPAPTDGGAHPPAGRPRLISGQQWIWHAKKIGGPHVWDEPCPSGYLVYLVSLVHL